MLCLNKYITCFTIYRRENLCCIYSSVYAFITLYHDFIYFENAFKGCQCFVANFLLFIITENRDRFSRIIYASLIWWKFLRSIQHIINCINCKYNLRSYIYFRCTLVRQEVIKSFSLSSFYFIFIKFAAIDFEGHFIL